MNIQVIHTQLSILELKMNTLLTQISIVNDELDTEIYYHRNILNNIIERLNYNKEQLYQIKNTIKELKRNTKEHYD